MKVPWGRRSVRYYRGLFVGWFTTMVMAAALICTCLMAIWSAANAGVPVGTPARVHDASTGETVTYFQSSADLGGLISILALTIAISAFLSVMVASSTFAFAVALRRRDLALLRLLGAGGRHIRRIVRTEALAMGVPAAIVGCGLASVVYRPISGLMNRTPLADGALQTAPVLSWPWLITISVLVPIAVVASRPAAARAAGVAPIEALRAADVDDELMTPARWLGGGLLAVGGGLMCVLAPGVGASTGAGAAIPLVIFGGLGLTAAAVAMTPVYLPGLLRLIGAAGRTVPAWLARASVQRAHRRSAALAAPMVAFLAASAIVVSVLQTTAASETAELHARTQASLVLTGQPIPEQALAEIAQHDAVAGVAAASPVRAVAAASYAAGPGETEIIHVDVPGYLAAHGATVTGTAETPQDLNVAVSSEFSSWQEVSVGDEMQVGFFDGTTERVRIQAVIDAGPAVPPTVFLSAELSEGHRDAPSSAFITLHPDTDLSAVAAESVHRGVTATPVSEWIERQQDAQAEVNLLVLAVLAVPGLVFTLVAIGSATAMGFSTRNEELRILRSIGATRRDLRAMILAEPVLLLGPAALLISGALTAVTVASYVPALAATYTSAEASIPWPLHLALAGVALTMAAGSALLALRRSRARASRSAPAAPGH